MIAQMLTSAFYEPFLIGLVGLVTNLLVKRYNQLDPTVTGPIHRVFLDRMGTILLAVLSHFMLCVIAFNVVVNGVNQLTIATGLFAGYFNQSMLTVVMENAKARQLAKLTGEPPPSKGD
jgi:hypothetical protein